MTNFADLKLPYILMTMKLVKDFSKMNNLLGWIVFLVASTVYLLTIEPTASWWDCGEYVSTAFKLEVGHPPGAPFFQMLGRVFSLFAFGNTANVAMMVNIMSALMSGFSILFLFWTITALAKKMFTKTKEMSLPEAYIVLGAGLVGALACTFTDSFWFSAVEGEVYATSAFFTAIVFWLMLKWEVAADEKYSNRYIVLIAFLMGLAIGVHLLNLLTIPALTFIYYFRKVKQSRRNFVYALIACLAILGFIQVGIIPWTVKMAGYFELFFINTVGMPFNSGTIIFFVFLIAIIVGGLFFSKKYSKTFLHTAILCFTFILIGYSSFVALVIRANANTPINENSPEDAISLLNYLNRDQYGDWPVLYGQYFNAKVIDSKEVGYNYIRGDKKYVRTNAKIKYVYDPNNCGLFPRMWSDQDKHVKGYTAWTGVKPNRPPTFGENLEFFFGYQLGSQYWRYFMWNFVGRQNDFQGFTLDEKGNRDVMNGNWLSGIPFIDSRLGNQDKLPEKLTSNKARNTLYFLPFLLGLVGLFYQWKKDKKDAWVVSLFFLLTGMAIIVYLNPVPYQPRERDYAYAGSFYAFCIWIGFGVVGLWKLLSKKVPQMLSVFIVTLACLILVPGIMAKEEWNDHDRSGKYACRDFAMDYLMSCSPNSILITNGDNDTFPLWYAQEVEDFRTDVRVVNFTLASGDWYIHQLFNNIYKSKPLPFTIPSDKYTNGTNDFVPYYDNGFKGSMSIQQLIKFINSGREDSRVKLQDGKNVAFFPTKTFYIPVDSAKVVSSGLVPREMADQVVKFIPVTIKKNTLYKNDLMLLDFLASNDWSRPVYFASPSSVKDFLDIEDYCYMEGCVYKFIPVKADAKRSNGILTKRSYDVMMNEFKFGNLNDPHVYVDKESFGMAQFLRNNYARLGQALLIEGQKTKAIKALDKGIEAFPDRAVAYDMYMIGYGEMYYQLGEFAKGNEMMGRIADIYQNNLEYYFSLDPERAKALQEETEQGVQVLQAVWSITEKYKQADLHKKVEAMLSQYIQIPQGQPAN